jgi:hypothetical protein
MCVALRKHVCSTKNPSIRPNDKPALSARSGLMLEKLQNAFTMSPALSVVGGFAQERKLHPVNSDELGKSVTTESGPVVANHDRYPP